MKKNKTCGAFPPAAVICLCTGRQTPTSFEGSMPQSQASLLLQMIVLRKQTCIGLLARNLVKLEEISSSYHTSRV
jgi:hypothetical protein